MTGHEFKAFLSLLIVSDPWPLSPEKQALLIAFANDQAKMRGYDSWIAAYHAI